MSQQRRLLYLLAINLVMIVGLVLVGVLANSLSVLAAGGDFAADSFAIILGLLAIRLRDTRGNKRATTYVALINATLLLTITVFVCIEAVGRLVGSSPEIHGLPVLIVAGLSSIAMTAGALILGRKSGNEDLHMRSVLLDTVADGLSALTVAVIGGIIYLAHGLYWLDATAAIIIAIVIAATGLRLLRDGIHSLRQSEHSAAADDI